MNYTEIPCSVVRQDTLIMLPAVGNPKIEYVVYIKSDGRAGGVYLTKETAAQARDALDAWLKEAP